MDRLDGRNIGKMDRLGYLKGTKAWLTKFKFIGGFMAFSLVFTVIKVYIGPGKLFTYLEGLEELHKERERRADGIRLKRLEKQRESKSKEQNYSYTK